MSNIFPEVMGGGVEVTDASGAVLPGPFSTVVNGYVPPATFHMACPVTYYAGRACDMRFQPYQINAIESELLALAAAMDPTGTWSCGRVTNLAAAYHNAMASLSGVPIVDPFGVVAGYAMAGPISPAPAAIFAVNQSNFGPEFQIGTRIPNQITLLYEPSTQTPQPGTQSPQIGTSTDFARADHSHKETVTSLTYDPVTKFLHFTDEAGAAHTLDLSALAIDVNVTGATWNATTGVLTLTEDDGGPTVTVDLSTLKAVNTSSSVTGNGDTVSITLVNDQAAPGASMLYGTNAAGVKGWYAQPSGGGGISTVNTTQSVTGNGVGTAISLVNDNAAPGASMLYGTNAAGVKGWYAQPSGGGGLTAATMASTMAGTGVGALFQWEDTGFGSPARGVVGTGLGGNTVNWPGTGALLCPGSVIGGQYTCLGRTTSGYLAVRTA